MSAADRHVSRGLSGLLSEDRFEVLFGLLLALLLSGAFVRSGVVSALVTSGLVVATMLVTFRSSGIRLSLPLVLIAVACGAAVLVLSATSPANGPLRAVSSLIIAVTLGIGPPIVLRRIFQHPSVTTQDILAALSVYLQAGLAFAFTYAAVDQVAPKEFLNQGVSEQATDYIYFSFVTMLTVGYGDFVPVTDFGRMLVIIQALFGQILLVVLIAYLVGAVVAKAGSRRS